MKKLEPFSLEELDQVAAVAHSTALAWTVRTIKGRELIWATSAAQAITIATNAGAKVKGVTRNHHAQNMHPRPADWSEFVAMGGGI